MDASKFIATRTPDNLKVIVLHEVSQDFDGLSTELDDCLITRACGDSYHGYYSLETGYKSLLTPKQQSLTWVVAPAVIDPNCPVPVDSCCIYPTTAPQYTVGQDPNNYTFNIAIKVSKPSLTTNCFKTCSDQDYLGIVNSLAEAYKAIKLSYPAFVLDATTLYIKKIDCCPVSLKCITDISKLITDALAVVALPVAVAGNPACSGFATTPAGTPILIIGQDAAGNCVKGAFSSTAGYRVTRPLGAGDTVITHNLALLAPFPSIVEVRDATTGDLVTAKVVPGTETANTLTINVAAAIATAKITVLK